MGPQNPSSLSPPIPMMGPMPIKARSPYICEGSLKYNCNGSKVLTLSPPPVGDETDNMVGFDLHTLVSEIHREQLMPELVTPPLPPPTSVESRHNRSSGSNTDLAQYIDAQEFVPYKLA